MACGEGAVRADWLMDERPDELNSYVDMNNVPTGYGSHDVYLPFKNICELNLKFSLFKIYIANIF